MSMTVAADATAVASLVVCVTAATAVIAAAAAASAVAAVSAPIAVSLGCVRAFVWNPKEGADPEVADPSMASSWEGRGPSTSMHEPADERGVLDGGQAVLGDSEEYSGGSVPVGRWSTPCQCLPMV